jgi:hypothetical protein
MRRTILALAVLAAALIPVWGCLSDSTRPVVRKPTPHESLFYFDVTYTNQAWGYRLSGWFIDDEGAIFRFDHSDQEMAVADIDTIGAFDLLEKYSRGQRLIGYVNPRELAQMRALVDAAAAGYLTPLTPTGCADAGTLTYQAWRLLSDRPTYARVLLHEKGDLGRRNSTAAAETLRAWLDRETGADFPDCEPE